MLLRYRDTSSHWSQNFLIIWELSFIVTKPYPWTLNPIRCSTFMLFVPSLIEDNNLILYQPNPIRTTPQWALKSLSLSLQMPYLLSTDGSLAVQKDVKALTAAGNKNVVRRMFVVNDPSFPPGTQRWVDTPNRDTRILNLQPLAGLSPPEDRRRWWRSRTPISRCWAWTRTVSEDRFTANRIEYRIKYKIESNRISVARVTVFTVLLCDYLYIFFGFLLIDCFFSLYSRLFIYIFDLFCCFFFV